MLNKPRGYVTTLSDEKGRHNVAELVSDAGGRLYPVGRLDMYSEGLLIMTDDGEAANVLMHPSHNVKKTYHAWVRGEDIKGSVGQLRRPINIDGITVRASEVTILSYFDDGALLEVKISEGRNRQVRKMCDASGLRVSRLIRVAEGDLQLGDLPSGKWRYLTIEEIAYVRGIG
jgi:23S rRNA pseudouridine2605 synthase